MALAALRQWTVEEPSARSGAGSIRSRSCRTGGSSLPTRRLAQRAGRRWCWSRSPMPQVFNEMLRVLGHARADAFIRAGAARLTEVLGPGTAIYHVDLLSFAFRAARPRRARVAGDDRPRSSRLPRADPVRRRADRHPHRHRPARHRPRRLEPGRGPARGALRRAGQPRRALRLGLVRPQDATRRTAAPSGCSPTSSRRSSAEGQLELHYQPKVTLEIRRLRQRRGAAALDPSAARPGLAGRVRAAGRDHRAGDADDPLGDRRGDPAGRALAARGHRPRRRGQRLAEEPRGGGLRRVPAVLLRGARPRPGADRARDHRGRQRRARRR